MKELQVGCVGYSAIGFEGAAHGLGAELWSIKPDDITHLFAVSNPPFP